MRILSPSPRSDYDLPRAPHTLFVRRRRSLASSLAALSRVRRVGARGVALALALTGCDTGGTSRGSELARCREMYSSPNLLMGIFDVGALYGTRGVATLCACAVDSARVAYPNSVMRWPSQKYVQKTTERVGLAGLASDPVLRQFEEITELIVLPCLNRLTDDDSDPADSEPTGSIPTAVLDEPAAPPAPTRMAGATERRSATSPSASSTAGGRWCGSGSRASSAAR